MALEKELSLFQQKLPEFLAEHTGQFALIHDNDAPEFFTSYEDAIKAGYSKFGLEPFLVKQVQAIEQVHFISRLIEPAA